MSRASNGSVPVQVAAKVYGKDPSWVRAGIISGWLPIGTATRAGKKVTAIDEMSSKYGRINYYISPQLLFEQTGFKWKGDSSELKPITDSGIVYLNKHRYLELKHFCMQYPEWVRIYNTLTTGTPGSVAIDRMIFKTGIPSDPTAARAIAAQFYRDRIDLVKGVARDACGDMWSYILEAATTGKQYEQTDEKVKEFDDNFRKFFSLLHLRRE